MKRNLIITGILVVYAVTFILLFVRLRGMSGMVLEELSENNIYYMLGFMFIVGISATMYLIMEANDKQFSLSLAKESESITFDYETKSENAEEQEVASNLQHIKQDLESIFRNGSTLTDKLEKSLWKFCEHFEISQALVYIKEKGRDQLTLQATYAFVFSENDSRYILSGEGLTGQAVKDQKPYFIKDIPEGYLKVLSGLGESLPKSLLIIPCSANGEVKVVFELSSLKEYTKQTTDDIVSICNYVSELTNQ
jgi:hypothetical protein